MNGNRSILGVLEGMAPAAVTVRQERCAKVRNRNVACLECADACTSGCISVVDGRLAVDASKCVGCGTCATVCPTCALEARNPSDVELLEACLRTRRGGEVLVSCKALDAGEGAQVVCLGRVDESLMCALAAEGVAEVTLACGDCARCELEHGLRTACLVASTANSLLQAWGSEARVRVEQRAERPADAAPVAVEPQAPSTSAEEPCAPLRVMKDGTLPHFVPDRRERLLDSLAALGQPVAERVSTRLWGMVVIDGSKCSSCRMCATFCPPGAIRKFDNDDGTFGVDHVPADCVKCGSCRDVCPEDAIVLLDDVKPSALVDGDAHHYTMRPRPVQLGDAHQIVNTLRHRMQGTDLFER